MTIFSLVSFPHEIIIDLAKRSNSVDLAFSCSLLYKVISENVAFEKKLKLADFNKIMQKKSEHKCQEDKMVDHKFADSARCNPIKFSQITVKFNEVDQGTLSEFYKLKDSSINDAKAIFGSIAFSCDSNDFLSENNSKAELEKVHVLKKLLSNNLRQILAKINSFKMPIAIEFPDVDMSGDGVIDFLVVLLKNEDCQIFYLNLSNCQIYRDGKVSLAQVLANNKSLKFLDLSDNFPFIQGFSRVEAEEIAQVFVNAIKQNKTLQFLDLANSSFTEECSKTLCDLAIQKKDTFHLKLEGKKLGKENKIDEDSKSVLNHLSGIVGMPKGFGLSEMGKREAFIVSK